MDVAWIVNNVAAGTMDDCIDIVLQPFINIQRGNCAGAEVLVRGYRDQQIIYPNAFIPLLERNGTILQLDLFVFAKGVAFAREARLFRRRDFVLSFNFSPCEFNHLDFVSLIISHASRAEARNLILEITETEMMLDDTGLSNLKRLQEYGFHIAWDDMTSLHLATMNLRHFPCHYVKLDRSMMFAENLSMASEVIDYCQQCQREIIVEGVETETQLAWLQARNITLVQGYYFSPPVDKNIFRSRFLVATN